MYDTEGNKVCNKRTEYLKYRGEYYNLTLKAALEPLRESLGWNHVTDWPHSWWTELKTTETKARKRLSRVHSLGYKPDNDTLDFWSFQKFLV